VITMEKAERRPLLTRIRSLSISPFLFLRQCFSIPFLPVS